jgi:hypothetical protein
VRVMCGRQAVGHASLTDIGRYAVMAEAAQRLRVAMAVVTELTTTPIRQDPSVLALACEELAAAEADYCRCGAD